MSNEASYYTNEELKKLFGVDLRFDDFKTAHDASIANKTAGLFKQLVEYAIEAKFDLWFTQSYLAIGRRSKDRPKGRSVLTVHRQRNKGLTVNGRSFLEVDSLPDYGLAPINNDLVKCFEELAKSKLPSAIKNNWVFGETNASDIVYFSEDRPGRLPEDYSSGEVEQDIDAGDEDIVESPLNQILYGPPGTGKTWSVVSEALGIIDATSYSNADIETYEQKLKPTFDKLANEGQIVFVTFHQSYGYEDFVIGIKPRTTDEGDVTYEVIPGKLKQIADEAGKDTNKGKNYILIIDEINRGNISKIFGELITLVEADKRIGAKYSLMLQLPCSEKGKESEQFGLPKNLYIIGTMNTADRSLAQLDIALRRRFDFKPMLPKPELLKSIPADDGITIDLRAMLEKMNERIEALYDRDHTIGHAYFMPPNGINFRKLKDIFQNRIIPLLEEYFFEDWGKIRLVLGDNQKKEDNQFITRDAPLLELLFGKDKEAENHTRNVEPRYKLNPDAFDLPESYCLIYQPKSQTNEPSQ